MLEPCGDVVRADKRADKMLFLHLFPSSSFVSI